MKKFIFLMIILLIANASVFAQQIGIGTENPHSTSLLELKSTNKGFLPPRMTTAQRNAIISPAEGLTIYNTTTSCLNAWSGSAWVSMCQIVTPDNKITITNSTGITYTGSIYVYYPLYTFPIASCPFKFNGVTTIKSLTSFNTLSCRGEIPTVTIPAGGNMIIEVTGTADTPFLPTETRGRIVNAQINMTTALDDGSTLLNSTTSDLRQTNNIITHFVANSLTVVDKGPTW